MRTLARLFVPCLLGLAAVASAQTVSEDEKLRREEPIRNAFDGWRGTNIFFVRMEGTEAVDGKTYDLLTDLYWHVDRSSGQPVAKVELQKKYRLQTTPVDPNGWRTAQRVVGDGAYLYNYRHFAGTRNGEYSAVPYSRFIGGRWTPGERYIPTLLTHLTAAAGDTDAYLVRLLREVYGGEGATSQYRRWIPTATPESTETTVTYRVGDPVRRQITFNFDPDTDALLSIMLFDTKRVGSSYRTVNAVMTPQALTQISPDLFHPYPLDGTYGVRGWRLIPGPRQSQ
jgi:hypothetical protein